MRSCARRPTSSGRRGRLAANTIASLDVAGRRKQPRSEIRVEERFSPRACLFGAPLRIRHCLRTPSRRHLRRCSSRCSCRRALQTRRGVLSDRTESGPLSSRRVCLTALELGVRYVRLPDGSFAARSVALGGGLHARPREADRLGGRGGDRRSRAAYLAAVALWTAVARGAVRRGAGRERRRHGLSGSRARSRRRPGSRSATAATRPAGRAGRRERSSATSARRSHPSGRSRCRPAGSARHLRAAA
jgi:hypothetical protein